MGVLSSGKMDSGSESGNQTGPLGIRGLLNIEAKIHQKMMDDMDPMMLGKLDRHALVREVHAVTSEILSGENLALPVRVREQIVANVINEIVGYGPIQSLLDDPTITEIMVNGPNQVYAERGGKLFLTDKIFRDDQHVMRIIEKIVMPLGRRIDESSPMVD
ncbi:MAG: CpaF family protein, partial [Armatimonadota bacterium]|nr:CpaF family protein [Armatimonadota bacterium]